MTYYKYLERRLVSTQLNRTALRLATGDFTSTAIGAIFKPHFQRLLSALKWENGINDKNHIEGSALTIQGANGKLYHYILEGLYHLLRHLQKSKRDFAFVIRTYGLDARNVLESLNYGLNRNKYFEFEESLLRVPVEKIPGHIHRPSKTNICLDSYSQQNEAHLHTSLTHERDIYHFLCNSKV